ncbi:hypothetical protein BKA69DRAFT_1107778 [Paraphysoderma sedebokerense]|nr:hypothetical protein BKA69DRAFT_1107778 [Paraphysoderma sedebokerense]
MNENNVVITPSDSQRIIKTAQTTPMSVNPALLTAAKQVAATGTPLTMNLGTTQQSTNVITIQNPVTMNLPDAQNIMVAVQRGENVDAELVKAAQTVLQTQTPLQGVMNTTVPVAPGKNVHSFL